MAISVSLAGFPTVLRCRVSQGSSATPGSIIADTTVAANAATDYPETTTLTITFPGGSFTWNDIRVRHAPRIRNGYMRTTFDDSRWKLREVLLGVEHNLRDGSGQLITDSEKTTEELAALIGGAAGINIGVGTVSNYKPPAAFRGKSARECLNELLRDSVSRLLYNPISARYMVHASGSGSLPSFPNRFWRDGPDRGISSVIVRAFPTLKEEKVSLDAVYDDAYGSIESLSDHNPEGYFNGFVDDETDLKTRAKLRECAFRFWRASGSDREFLPHRALSIAPAAGVRGFAECRLLHKSENPDPDGGIMWESANWPQGGNSLSLAHGYGGNVYHSQNPFIAMEGGSIKTTVTGVVGFYELEDGKRKCIEVTRATGGSGTEKTVYVPWIRPIESSEPDIPSEKWTELHNDVADALQVKFSKPTRIYTLPGIKTWVESGHIGAVEYVVHSWPRPNAMTRIACNFDPSRGMVF